MRGVGGAGRDERRHGSGLGDPLFQELAVFGLPICQERMGIDRLIKLAHIRIDTELLKEGFHAERSGLVGDNGHDPFADFFFFQQTAEQADKGHRGRELTVAAALVKLLEQLRLWSF